MEKEGLDFKSALEWFARNFAVDCRLSFPGQQRRHHKPKPKVIRIDSEARFRREQEFVTDPELYAWFISKCARVSSPAGITYLNAHGISKESANNFEIRELRDANYAFCKLVDKWGKERVYRAGIAVGKDGNTQRLIWHSYALLFPFYEQGVVTYIQARMFESEPKFLNPRGLAKPVFNMDRLRSLRAGQLVHLCEGVPDAIALESHGLAAVGILGAASFRADWVDMFLKFKVVLLGDGDVAGAHFDAEISKFFLDRGKVVKSVFVPKGKDVADVLAQGRGAK